MFWNKTSHEESKPTGPRVNIDPVSPEMYDNPWYPLSGPPRNPEEQELLEQTIKEEQQKIHSELTQKSRITKKARHEMTQYAGKNCADLELEWKMCLSTFTFDRFLTMCNSRHEKLQECIAIQTRNLERLQFLSYYTSSPSKLPSIIDKADQMYLDEMKQRSSS
jgi:hypothetical protein